MEITINKIKFEDNYNYSQYTAFQAECRIKQDLAEVLGLDETDIDVEVDER